MKNHMDRAFSIPGNRVYLIFLYLSSTLLNNGHSLDLTIDNRLLVVPADCYTRVSIGSRLVDSLVISTIQANAVGDCEAACSTNGTSCGSFSFGIGNRGNGSCMLGSRAPGGPMDLQRDTNYDVYAKGKISLRGCQTSLRMSLNTAPMTSTSPLPSMNPNGVGSLTINTNRPQRLFGNNSLLNTFENSVFNRNRNNNRSGNSRNMGRPVSPLDFINDDRLRTSDILYNKQDYRNHQNDEKFNEEKSHFDELNNPKITDDKWTPDKWQQVPYGFNYFPIIAENHFKQLDYNNYENHNANSDFLIIEDEKLENTFGKRLTSPKVYGEFQVSTVLKKPKPQPDEDDYITSFDDRFGFGDRLNEEKNPGIDVNNFWINPSSSIKRPSAQQNDVTYASAYQPTNEVKACFRRLLSGKRIADPYVKRVMECERLHDCHRICEYERGFTCEGFNYRPRPEAKGMCELVSMAPHRVDINRDFVSDPRYDYYERDWTRRKCEPRVKVQPSYSGASGTWWGETPLQRPGWAPPRRPGGQYIPTGATVAPPITPRPAPPQPYGGTFVEHTSLTFDSPRPIDHNRRRPDPWFRPGPNDVARPTHPPPLPVRPLEDGWPTFPQTRPERPDDFHGDVDGHRRPMMGFPPRYVPSRPSDDGYSGNGYSYGRPGDGTWMAGAGRHGEKYPVRRVGYTPDPATNEISPQYIPDRRKPAKPDTSEGYGPSYADGYPTHHSPLKPRTRPLNPEPAYAKAPPEHDSYYGPFYNYGSAYGYSDRPAPPKISSPTSPIPRDCSIRSAGGFRLARGIIRKSYLTANLGQCENLCQSQKEFACLTFAYRYSLAATSPADNCLLSNAPFENLVFYTDLEPDRDYDIYAMMANAKCCDTRGRPSSSPRRPRPPDECFWRVRTGFGMPPSVVKKPTRVEGMGECQVECVRSRDFTCRSFVFRYDSHSVSGLPNCYLSDWPAVEMDPHKMQDMDGAELYERGSFGRGCEPHHPIPSPDPPTPTRPALDYKPSRSDEASCYAGYDRPCKLTPYAIILTAKVDSEGDCRKKCTVMRQNVGRNSPPCMSFSYKITDVIGGDNCHISDVPTRDLRPGLDYTHDDDYSLYVFKELEPKCSHLSDDYPTYIPLAPSDHPPSVPTHSPKPYANPEDPYYYDVNVPNPNKPSETGLGYPYPQDERFFFPTELTVFSHYTVNGYPCKRGTKCERHPIAGFWSCQPEGSEPDSWDYCCEPSHQCGFSQGFSYPWCYVGASPDQWRPCSERYYPYSPKPTIPKPSRPITHRPHFVKCEYEVDCGGRHWPVAVLHGESPPNGTDSVALANNHNHRELNNSDAVEPSVKSIDEGNNDSNTSGGTVKKRKTEEVVFLPVRLINGDKINKSEPQRTNSRFKPIQSLNSSLVNVSRVSRNDNNPQFFITKRLNAGFSTETERPRGSGERAVARGSGAVAKIERIVRPGEGRREGGQQLVTVTSLKGPRGSPGDLKNDVPAVAVVVANDTTVIPNSTRRWVKMDTIDSEGED